ncbi:MAG: hypothetical protein ABI629_01560 [bacterium]
MNTPVAQMTRTAILTALRDDGFDLPASPPARAVATSLQAAARAGCLRWGADRIVSTLPEHLIDLRRVRAPRR